MNSLLKFFTMTILVVHTICAAGQCNTFSCMDFKDSVNNTLCGTASGSPTVNVQLLKCEKDSPQCDLNIGSDITLITDKQQFKCNPTPAPSVPDRLPGEKCDATTKCVTTWGSTCDDKLKTCTTPDISTDCNQVGCQAGSSCDTTPKTCTANTCTEADKATTCPTKTPNCNIPKESTDGKGTCVLDSNPPSCKTTSDCLLGSVCSGGICTTKVCNDVKQCSVGNFCQIASNEKLGTCQKQLAVGVKCSFDFDCENNSGCLNGQCTE